MCYDIIAKNLKERDSMRGGTEIRHNAHRIACALADLEASSNDYKAAIKSLAQQLHYSEAQLLDDMHDLIVYIRELECKGSVEED